MPTLNLGILAHVDAGKTTLTERLLYDAGVIDTLGSVDAGSTLTDFLPLERERGITIKSAVVSFAIGATTVNLIDTPGHPDFIAEVERALAVLDGVVLVISAVEGVQPQTRVLMRALQRLRVPTILFVNKIDRRGARDEDLLAEIERRLGIDVVAMSRVEGLGTKEARAVAITSVDVSNAHPVFFGSALTGTGVDTLARGVTAHLPSARDCGDELSACVFKIDRGRAGERVAYVRVFGGALRVRQRVEIADGAARKVTGIEVFRDGQCVRTDAVTAGEIAKVRGLTGVRIGDAIGVASTTGNADTQFGPPTLEATVHADDEIALRTALGQLAEQDPLINIRYDDERHELSVSLYGDVQREVIEATLVLDYGIAVTFGAITTVYVERPVGVGEAIELYQEDRNPTSATMAMRVEAAAPGAGLEFVLEIDGRTVPLHIYKSTENFVASMRDYLRRALREGLRGWAVTDCRITMTQCNYYVGDGPAKPTRPTPKTSAADFRNLTPLVVMKALERAGTVVCGPMMRVVIECPGPAAARASSVLARCGGSMRSRNDDLESVVIEGRLPADRVQDLRRELNVLTSGEAVVEAVFAGYEPVPGRMPTRQRTTADPLNRKSYFLQTMRNRPVRN